MGKKGDKAKKEGSAIELYSQGMTLEMIAKSIGSSVTSLSRWKKDSKHPDKDLDEWDLARQGYQSFTKQIRELNKEDFAHIKSLHPSKRTSADYTKLSISSSLVRTWINIEKEEVAKQLQETAAPDFDKPAMFLANLEWMAAKLKDIDPEGLKVLGRNIDMLVIQFKTEHAAGKQ